MVVYVLIDFLFFAFFFFFNDTATTEIYTLSLHDALPILPGCGETEPGQVGVRQVGGPGEQDRRRPVRHLQPGAEPRSEEHTSELQSRLHLVCRLLLEKKKKKKIATTHKYNLAWNQLDDTQ